MLEACFELVAKKTWKVIVIGCTFSISSQNFFIQPAIIINGEHGFSMAFHTEFSFASNRDWKEYIW